jgi:hypothetical protein
VGVAGGGVSGILCPAGSDGLFLLEPGEVLKFVVADT